MFVQSLAGKLASVLLLIAMMVLWFMCIFRPGACTETVRFGALAALVLGAIVLVALMFAHGPSLPAIVGFVFLIPQLVLWYTCAPGSGDCSAGTKWGGAGLAILGFIAALFVPL